MTRRPDLTTQVKQSFDVPRRICTDYLDSPCCGPYNRRGLGDADWRVWAAIETLSCGRKQMIGGITWLPTSSLLCAGDT